MLSDDAASNFNYLGKRSEKRAFGDLALRDVIVGKFFIVMFVKIKKKMINIKIFINIYTYSTIHTLPF